MGLQAVLIRSDCVRLNCINELNSITPQSAALVVILSELSDSNSLVHAILYRRNLTVNVGELDKICSFLNNYYFCS